MPVGGWSHAVTKKITVKYTQVTSGDLMFAESKETETERNNLSSFNGVAKKDSGALYSR